MTSVAVVVPTIREDCAKQFLKEWADDLAGVRIVMVEDNPEQSFALDGCEHYSWHDIEADLGDRSWIIPRRSSAVRSYGSWLAWKGGADIIWALDDDCYPEPGRAGTYLTMISDALAWPAPQGDWHNTVPAALGVAPRGFPYGIRSESRPVMVHHGLWSNIPDLDGRTALERPHLRFPPASGWEVVPKGQFFPMCGMNLAWRAEMTPAMYMLLQGQDAATGQRYPFDRFDDMWAGLFAKRIADHLGYAITSGAPSVHHSKASDAEQNAVVEAPGIEAHETFWRYIAGVPLTETTVTDCYRELADAVWDYAPGYWRKLSGAMDSWTALFEEAR